MANVNPVDFTGLLANPNAFRPFDDTQWEWIVGDEAPDEDTITAESGLATMSGYYYDHVTLWDAVAYFIGFSQVNPSSDVKLIRHLPAVHPRWPWFRCRSVSVKGVKYDGTEEPLVKPQSPLPLPRYDRYRFDCHFEQPKIQYLEDNDPNVTTEWDRMLLITDEDETEVVVTDGGQWYYLEPTGPGALNNTAVVLNGPLLKTYAQRSGLVVVAEGIPADFIYNIYGIPVHFLAAKGRINSTTFLGLPAQTLLLKSYKIEKYVQPVATKTLNTLLFGCRVNMYFSYTDPTRADAAETRRGWNLVPGIKGSDKWYGIRNIADASQNLYPEYDMNKLLQKWTT